MIAHLRGREKALEPFGWTGPPGRVDRVGLSPRWRLHQGAGEGLSALPPREGAPRCPQACRTGRGRRREPVQPRWLRPRVPSPRTQDLTGARRGGQAPTTDHFQGSVDAAAPLARLRARTPALALAPDRAREGGLAIVRDLFRSRLVLPAPVSPCIIPASCAPHLLRRAISPRDGSRTRSLQED